MHFKFVLICIAALLRALSVCMSVLVVSLIAASEACKEPRRERMGGHGRSSARIRCCKNQRGREEHVAVSDVAGKRVVCLSVKLIKKVVKLALLQIINPASTKVRLFF